MKFTDITNRITGFSTPVFGVSWNPPELERTTARRIIRQLEDRRVLYNPTEVEVPEHCVHSIIHIRRMLTDEISKLDDNSKLIDPLRAMRGACRKFLDNVQQDDRIIRFGSDHGHFASWVFISAVGELRGIFGVHLVQIATLYGLDIEDELAQILPGQDET